MSLHAVVNKEVQTDRKRIWIIVFFVAVLLQITVMITVVIKGVWLF
jgi:hypothetical protein